MATKFLMPPEEAIESAQDEELLNQAPPVIERCPYLREKATGVLHVYNEHMARRGDLVEAYWGEPAPVIEPPASAALSPVSTMPPVPSVPPVPPVVRRRASS
jgi:hypothetical protein